MLISIEWGYFAFYYLLNVLGSVPRTVYFLQFVI